VINLKEEKVIALQIHGSPIRYSLPIPGKSDLFRTYETKDFLKHLNKMKKERLPLLDLWSSKYKIVVADFDHLPKTFTDWSDFRKFLSFQYGHMGLVLKSPSGKAKMMFLIELPDGQAMSLGIALDTLDWFLEGEERKAIDRSESANCRCFINERMYNDIRNAIDRLPIFPAILDSAEDKPLETKIVRRWNFLAKDAIGLDLLKEILTTKAQWFLARYILGSAKLAMDEIDLPQPYIIGQAEIQGDYVPSLPALSSARASFVKLGLLELTDAEYGRGKKGMSYRATGILLQACETVLEHQTPRADHVPPVSIVDGEWNTILLKEVNYFLKYELWNDWFYSLPGCREKDREKKMKNIWNYHLKSKVA